jgi:3',5'-cyclic AMP phosphodiesterase CpdA
MRVAHISDLHYSKSKSSNDFSLLFDALIEKLKEENKKLRIDLIFITGDLVDKGGISFGANEDFYKIIERNVLDVLAASLDITRDRIVIMPGNHDVEEGKQNFHFLRSLRTKTKEPTKDSNAINAVITDHETSYDDNLKGLEKFNSFEKSFYSEFLSHNENNKTKTNTLIKCSNFESFFIYTFNKIKIGVVAFNTAWSCSVQLDDKPGYEKVLFGFAQIQRAKKFLDGKTDFNIALLHHPLEKINDDEVSELKHLLSIGKFNILFCGHTHMANDANDTLYEVTSKSVFNDPRIKIERYRSGFSLLDLSYLRNDNHIIYNDRINVTRRYFQYIHPDRFDLDVQEAKGGERSRTLFFKEKNEIFIEFLKNQDPSYDFRREQLFLKVNAVTQEYIRSYFSQFTDVVLRKFLNRLLPENIQYNHLRENLNVTIEIRRFDNLHFKLIEKQTYEIDSKGAEVNFTAYAYIDRDAGGSDKSDIKITKFAIGEIDYSKEFKLDPDTDIKKRIKYKFEKKLTLLKKRYTVVRVQESINSFKRNKVWYFNISYVFRGFDFKVKNPDKQYQIDLFDLNDNTSISNLSKEGLPTSKLLKIWKPDEILVPDDCFLIIVNKSLPLKVKLQPNDTV